MDKKHVNIRQAVIPAAGLGSRFLPVTKCFPKELIPLVDKPCLLHIVEEALAAGVKDFIFVISREKHLIEDFFRPNAKLNEWLEARGQGDVLAMMNKLERQANYHFVFQDEPLGLGHAVHCAREAVTDDHFFVILPDDIITSQVAACEQMRRSFSEHGLPTVAVMPVKWEDVPRYGIVKAAPLTDDTGEVQGIVEKPKRENSPSNLAVIGRYILPKAIFPLLEKTQPGAGGEIQLTDALCKLVNAGGLRSFAFDGERYDTGTPLGWLEANISLALKHPQYQAPIREFLKLSGPY